MQSRIDMLFFQLSAITLILSAYGTMGLITTTFDESSVIFDFWHIDRYKYFSIGLYNIILVDWSVEAGEIGILGYVATYQKTAQLGNLVRKLLSHLKSRGGDYAAIHCIGHSLGAHVCNAAARSIAPDQLGRVTNLDPAAVLEFSMQFIRGQAKFSDIIHTSHFFGEIKPLADADFYPNGGLNQNCNQKQEGSFI
ncbi:hypothetical protein B566_EDAN007549 [Ephemera danica]|nr:hypothetical protein B566_EDAN007549 [Ephemera danica]